MRVHITGYYREALSEITALQEHLWMGGIENNKSYFEWKYLRNPYLDERYVSLAWASDRLIGMVGAFGACWSSQDGAIHMLPCLSDTVLAPEARGTDIFMALIDHLTERLRSDGIGWLLDFGDQPAAPALQLRGWRRVESWAVAERPADTNVGLAEPVPGLDITIEPRPDFAELAVLSAAQSYRGRFRHRRETAYFEWRHGNPLAEHTYVLAHRSNRLQGFMLAHRSKSLTAHFSPITVVDHASTDDIVWKALLTKTMRSFEKEHLSISLRELSAPQSAMLTENGFRIKRPSGHVTRDLDLPHLIVLPLSERPKPSGLNLPEAWDLSATCGRSWR